MNGKCALMASIAAAAIWFSAGCGGVTTYNKSKTLCQTGLDDRYDVRLVHRSVKHLVGLLPVERQEEIVVCVQPRPIEGATYELRSVEVDEWPSHAHFDYETVEARTDAGRQRIWFVNRDDGSIIGTVDRQSGKTTGPGDEAPAWATPDGGELLGAEPGGTVASAVRVVR